MRSLDSLHSLGMTVPVGYGFYNSYASSPGESPQQTSLHRTPPPIAPTIAARLRLDPSSIARRARVERLPSLGRSIGRGMLGFTALSVAGFAPWPIFDRWFHSMREMHLYIACTLIFVGLSGVILHRLILGTGS